jgi:hypothetical protein
MLPEPMASDIWTLTASLDQSAKLGTQANCGGVAKLTLRIAPHADAAVAFSSAVDLTDPGKSALVPFVQDGVMDFVQARAEQGKPVGFVHVTLLELWFHPIDSTGHRNRRAAYAALEQAFEGRESRR